MGSVGGFQESLELLRRGMDLMMENAPSLLQQQAQMEVSMTSLQSFMGETRQRLAALEERDKVREARLAALEVNLRRTLCSFFPRVDSLLSQFERDSQKNSVPSKDALREGSSTASISKEAKVSNDVPSDGSIDGVKKNQDKNVKKTNTSSPSPCPSAASTSSSASSPNLEKLNRDLVQAANEGNVSEICNLLAAGANINTKSASGKSPLSIAALNGHIECVNVLLDTEADIFTTDVEGFNCLHLAAARGKEVTLQSILATGVDVDIQTRDGATALTLASKFGHKKCILELLEYVADINVKDCDERTPLHHAVIGNNVECVIALLDSGADPYCLDKDEKSSLIYAIHSTNRTMREVMLNIADNRGNHQSQVF